MCIDIDSCINSSNVIISGMPLTRDNFTVLSLYNNEIIRLEDLYMKMDNKMFIAGGIPNEFYENQTIKNIDLLKIEELTILNAIPTSEGTIKIAIEESQKTIHESNVMIFGYGRIGKILCKHFKALGAVVYCVARDSADLAWIRQENIIPVKYNEVVKYINDIDIVVNTVPALVIGEKIFQKMKKDSFIIELASGTRRSWQKYGKDI